MFSWAQKRQFAIIGGAVLAFFILFVLPSYFILREQPSCSNGTQDGAEEGRDCGGSCRYLCDGTLALPITHFARAVPVGPGQVGAVAYLENRNPNAGARDVPYVLKAYDANGLLVGEKHGAAYLPPRKVFALFEGRMETGDRVPVRATFDWKEEPRFERMSEEPLIDIRNKRFETVPEGSRLDALLYNASLSNIRGIDVTALLFDGQGNVYAASATKVNELPNQSTAAISFTWPHTLREPARIEVLYTVPGR